MNYCVNHQFSLQYNPTINSYSLTKELNIDKNILQLHLWDASGAERIHPSSFYRHSVCCVLVFDLTDPKSFESIENWRNELLNKLNPIAPDTFPFVLLGNKCDKVSERNVQESKIKQYCETKSNMPYFETSARHDTNIDAAFEEVDKLAFKRNSKEDEAFIPLRVDF